MKTSQKLSFISLAVAVSCLATPAFATYKTPTPAPSTSNSNSNADADAIAKAKANSNSNATGGNSKSNATGGNSNATGGNATGGNSTGGSVDIKDSGNSTNTNNLTGGSNTNDNTNNNNVGGGSATGLGMGMGIGIGEGGQGGQGGSSSSSSSSNSDSKSSASNGNMTLNSSSISIPSHVTSVAPNFSPSASISMSGSGCGPLQSVVKTTVTGVFLGLLSNDNVALGSDEELAPYTENGVVKYFHEFKNATKTMLMGHNPMLSAAVLTTSGARQFSLGGNAVSGAGGSGAAGSSSGMQQQTMKIKLASCVFSITDSAEKPVHVAAPAAAPQMTKTEILELISLKLASPATANVVPAKEKMCAVPAAKPYMIKEAVKKPAVICK